MKFTILKETLLKPLQILSTITDKKHIMPILDTILFEVFENNIILTASNLETEIFVKIDEAINIEKQGKIAVPAKKIINIVKNLPDDINIKIEAKENNQIIVSSNTSRFNLLVLNEDNFPSMDQHEYQLTVNLNKNALLSITNKVKFAMANNDVRYFLNGMLWEIDSSSLKAVATDGHRLSVSEMLLDYNDIDKKQIIIPRESINDLLKFLSAKEVDNLTLEVANNHFRIQYDNYQFTSKLIDAIYPDYEKVIPRKNEKLMIVDKLALKQSLTRAAILANERYRTIRFSLTSDQLKLSASNADYEEANDVLDVRYLDEHMEIGVNVDYIFNVLSVIDSNDVDFYLDKPTSSILIKDEKAESCFVVMPVKL